MPELRKDPITDRWVIIATERARRPGNFINTYGNSWEVKKEECRYCSKKEPVLFVHPSNQVHVTSYTDSFIQASEAYERKSVGVYERLQGLRIHEVVVESNDHIDNIADLPEDNIAYVFETYALRMEEMSKNEGLRYAIAYKNHGWVAGGREIGHTRSHITATPIQPLNVKEKLTGVRNYYKKNLKCVFCVWLKEELENKKRVIEESAHFVAFAPFASRYLFEVLIVPKEHHCDYFTGVQGKFMDLAQLMKRLLLKLKIGLDDPAYNYALHTAPFRFHAQVDNKWSTIRDDYHWHIELLPQLTRIAGFEKGTDFYICSVPPEMTAQFLREVQIENRV